MFDQNTLAQLHANYLATRPQAQPKQPPKKKGNFLTSLIPSGGGIAGAAGGAALGTAILPGVGTLAGALLGGAFGGGAGKVAENAVEHNKLTSGVAGEAALNGIFGAGPLRLGKFGLDAARGIKTIGTAEKTLKTVEAAKGIPVKSIESTATGTGKALLPTTVPIPASPLTDTQFISRFKPGATQSVIGIPGVYKTATKNNVDPVNLIMNHLAQNATKGETRTIVSNLFPDGLDNSGKNSLVRALQTAGKPGEIKSLLQQAESKLTGQMGNVAPSKVKIDFTSGKGMSKILPAQQQATKTIEVAGQRRTLADVLQGAGNSAMDMSLTRGVGNKLSKSGEGLIAKEFRLNPTQQANFKNLHGEEAVSVLRRYGIKKPEDLQAKIQPLQGAFDTIVDSVPAISQGDLQSGLAKVYAPLLKSPALFEQGLGQQVKQQADELLKLAQKGSIPAAKVNELRKTFDAAVNYTQKGAPEYNVIKKTADALRGTLQNAADKAGVTAADGTTFKQVGKELSKLHYLDEVVGKQSYLSSGSLPISMSNLPGVVTGGAAGGLPGAVLGFAANAFLNSPAARRVAANTALKAGEKLVAKGDITNPYSVKALAGRIAPAGLAGALSGQIDQSSEGNNIPTTAIQTSAATMPNNVQNIGAVSQTDANMSTGNDPMAPENLQASIKQILANGGTLKDASDFVSLATALQKVQTTSTAPKLNSTQQQQANNANSGIAALQKINDIVSKDPLATLKASIPTNIGKNLAGGAVLHTAIGEAADVISRLRTGAAINKEEEAFYRRKLPAVGDTPDVIQYKLGVLSDLFSKFSNPQSAQPDLAGALAASGY